MMDHILKVKYTTNHPTTISKQFILSIDKTRTKQRSMPRIKSLPVKITQKTNTKPKESYQLLKPLHKSLVIIIKRLTNNESKSQ